MPRIPLAKIQEEIRDVEEQVNHQRTRSRRCRHEDLEVLVDNIELGDRYGEQEEEIDEFDNDTDDDSDEENNDVNCDNYNFHDDSDCEYRLRVQEEDIEAHIHYDNNVEVTDEITIIEQDSNEEKDKAK